MKRLLSGQRGGTLAETAILLPVLLLMVMAIMDAGHLIYDWVVLTNATREAARYGIAAERSLFESQAVLTADVHSHAVSQVSALLDPATLDVEVTVAMDSSGLFPATVTVDTNYTVPMITPLVKAIRANLPITVSSVMRAES